MQENIELEEFEMNHPWPDRLGMTSLYRFCSFNEVHPEYISGLLKDGKLYHSLPERLNDPWECRPHWTLPRNASKVKDIRNHLIKTAIRNGENKKKAHAIVSKAMKKPNFMKNTIASSIQKVFGEVRICSFASDKSNPLLWAHYADAHRGIYIEFDCTKSPINIAFKIKYQAEYPTIEYPLPSDTRIFIPVLTKAIEWEYEQEFRSIFVPEADRTPRNDGISLLLRGDEIRNVYFGANIRPNHKNEIVRMIENGIFSPKLWRVSLSQFSFKLEFDEIKR